MIVKILAAFLLSVSGYLAWWAVSYLELLWLLPAVVSFVAGIGLFLRKAWSQFLWYAIALAVSVFWIVSVVRIALSDWPDPDILGSIISLIPGALLLALCAGGSVAVYRYFRSGSANGS
jgi:hypothetical protein